MSSDSDTNVKGRSMALVAAFLGWMFDGLEMGLFPLAGRPALRELMGATGPDADKIIGPWFGGIIAAFLIGAAVGGVLFGWMGDRVGRVKAMVWSVATYSIFSGLCGFVNAPWQLGALRFVASLGMGGEWALGVSLVSEIWPAKSRPLLSGLIGAAANVGFFLVGVTQLLLMKYGTNLSEKFHAPLWRLLFIAGALPALLTFVIRIFVPESEKWKAATSSGPKPSVADIFAPGIGKFTALGAALAGVALLGTWAYLPELFPTRIRATGSGFCFNFGRVFAAGGSLVSGGLLLKFGGDYAKMGSVICLIYIVGVAVIIFCPETKGKPLPE
jgi:MFS family permease